MLARCQHLYQRLSYYPQGLLTIIYHLKQNTCKENLAISEIVQLPILSYRASAISRRKSQLEVVRGENPIGNIPKTEFSTILTP